MALNTNNCWETLTNITGTMNMNQPIVLRLTCYRHVLELVSFKKLIKSVKLVVL